MINLDILSDEMTNDLLVRGYSVMNNQEVADSLNTVNRTRIRASMLGDQIFQQTDAAQFNSLPNNKQQMWVSFCARETIDPRAAANISFVSFIFSSGATSNNLNAARNENISRATERGLATIGEGDVWDVRNG